MFHDKAEASLDAIRVGRLHCLQDQWSQALVSYMQCGGPILLQKAVEQKMASVAQKVFANPPPVAQGSFSPQPKVLQAD